MAKLASMRYKNYIWPHNPRVYEITYNHDVAAHRVPFGNYILQHMGRQHRVLRGEGAFVGTGAYDEFKKLATVFYERTPGVLVHPLWMTTSAIFAALRLRQEPTEDYVAYSFEFWECCDTHDVSIKPVGAARAGTQAMSYHTASAGENLWSIAAAAEVTPEALLAMNPQIRNPNQLAAGTVVRVR